jgi:DNA-binding response OmpR family regulator
VRVAILEDDKSQASLLESIVKSIRHSFQTYGTVATLQRALIYETFDLIIMDWMLPDGTGLDLARWLRQTRGGEMPILFITCRSDEHDVVAALNAGADDYVIKPIRVTEVTARISALLRRTSPRDVVGVMECGPYRLDTVARTMFAQGKPIELTLREFELALVFFKNLGRQLSRNYLLETAWKIKGQIDSRTLDTHVSRIRTKLRLREISPFRLVALYSCGYRMERISDVLDVGKNSADASVHQQETARMLVHP